MATKRITRPRLPVGRPSSYDQSFAEKAFKLCLLGAIDEEIADVLGISIDTLYEWKNAHSEFSEAFTRGKADADANVAKGLYHRAVGYSHDAVKIFMPAGAQEPVYAKYTEHYPPDTGAAKHWLAVRRGSAPVKGDPTSWREQTNVNHTGQLTLEHWVLESMGKSAQPVIEGRAREVDDDEA